MRGNSFCTFGLRYGGVECHFGLAQSGAGVPNLTQDMAPGNSAAFTCLYSKGSA
jgi:hypothetical protein